MTLFCKTNKSRYAAKQKRNNRFRGKRLFTSNEKAINTILTVLSSLTLSEKQFEIESKCNNGYKNINKLLLIVLFPFFDVQVAWQSKQSMLFSILGCGKDVFYRLINDFSIPWWEISFNLFMQLIGKTGARKGRGCSAMHIAL